MSAIEPVPQVTEEALKTMRPDQIMAAMESGACAELLGRPVPVVLTAGDSQLTEDEYGQLSPEQRAEAYQAGRLRDIVGGTGQ